MNVALWQLVLAVSIPTTVAMIGVLFSIITGSKLGEKIDRQSEILNAKIDRQGESLSSQIAALNTKIDRQTENFNNQVTTLLTTIHSVDVRVVKLEQREK